MNILKFRANPQHQKDDYGFFEKIVLSIIGVLLISGFVRSVFNSILKIWEGKLLVGIAGLIPPIAVFFLFIAALALTRGGGE